MPKPLVFKLPLLSYAMILIGIAIGSWGTYRWIEIQKSRARKIQAARLYYNPTPHPRTPSSQTELALLGMIGHDTRKELSPNFIPWRPEVASADDFQSQLASLMVRYRDYRLYFEGRTRLSLGKSSSREIFFFKEACDWYARSAIDNKNAGAACLPPGQARATQLQILLQKYQLGQSHRTALAASLPSDTAKASASCAAIFIPGTGTNPLSAVLRSDSIYNSTLNLLRDSGCNGFVLIKEAQDFLAIHRNGYIADDQMFKVQLLNRGLSYSATYLSDALALTKSLQARYPQVFVIGVSQGGQAALLTALAAQPTGAVISSAWSVLFTKILYATLDQIIVPGINVLSDPAKLFGRIRDGKTQYLFTYGRLEEDVFGGEAIELVTCSALKKHAAANTTCVSHAGGHEVPYAETLDWIARHKGELRVSEINYPQVRGW